LGSKSFEAVLDLAIFAELYKIYHLQNQTSDALAQEIREKLTPELLIHVYKAVPDGAVLRELCAGALSEPKAIGDDSKWKRAFYEYPELGWSFFVKVHNELVDVPKKAFGPCEFHDHSDVPTWKRGGEVEECPYPRGAPLGAVKKEESLGNEMKADNKVNGKVDSKKDKVDNKVNGKVDSKKDSKEEVQKANWEATSGEVTPKPEEAAKPAALAKSEVLTVAEQEPEPAVPSKKENKKKNKSKKKGAAEAENGTAGEGNKVTSS